MLYNFSGKKNEKEGDCSAAASKVSHLAALLFPAHGQCRGGGSHTLLLTADTAACVTGPVVITQSGALRRPVECRPVV